ncbi:MAG: mechanosensitive ion channel [Burkholderiales bacterium]
MLDPFDLSRLEIALTTPQGWVDLLIVAACLGIAWAIDRRLAAHARAREGVRRRHLQASVGRVVFSLLALALLLLVRPAFRAVAGPPLFMDIAIPMLVALAIIRMLVYFMRRLFADQSWLKTSERAIAFSMWGVVILYFIGVLPEIGRELDAIVLPIGRSSVSMLTIGKGAAAIVLTLIVTLWLSGLLEQRLLDATTFDTNTKAVMAKLLRAFLLVVGVLVALETIGFDLTLLTVFGGALGVGIGLGLQKLAANYIAGFTILLDKAVRLGDLITVDGRQGRVAQVTSRYVLLRGLDGVEAIVPNETLVTTTVLNHSSAAQSIRVSVVMQIAHDSDVELALRLMEEEARAEPRLVTAPEPPAALVNGFGDVGVMVELVLWVAGPQAGVVNLRSALNRRILASFARNGIAIAYPRRDGRPAGP